MNIHELDQTFSGKGKFPYGSPHLALVLKKFLTEYENSPVVKPETIVRD